MKKAIHKPTVRVIMMVDDELAYMGKIAPIRGKDEARVTATYSPQFNRLGISEAFLALAGDAETAYYMHHVKSLSKEAREAIEAAMAEDGYDEAPF